MSIRYKALRRRRYYATTWVCPICRSFNRRDFEGLDQCGGCGAHARTRYHMFDPLAPMFAEVEEVEGEEGTGRCWCGEDNPYYAPLPSHCGGFGTIRCLCGGDFCVCHWHGEVECFGCEDCLDTEFDDTEFDQ